MKFPWKKEAGVEQAPVIEESLSEDVLAQIWGGNTTLDQCHPPPPPDTWSVG